MNRPRRAFTLIELLTVMAILGLLIAILIPSLTSARRSAKASVCLSHLKGIGTSFVIYLNENDDQFPPVRLSKLRPDSEDFYINEHKRLRPRWQWFLETDQGPVIDPAPFQFAFRSPGYFHDDTPARGSQVRNARTMATDMFTCPALDDDDFARDVRDGAYGYNYQYLGNTRTDRNERRWDNFSVGLHQIRQPSQTIELADSRGAGTRHGKHSYTLDPPRLATERAAQRFGPTLDPDDAFGKDIDYIGDLDEDIFAFSPAEPRHRKFANVLFTDSHASSETLKTLGYQLSDRDTHPGLSDATPIPALEPISGEDQATNKLFTGDGRDELVDRQNTGTEG